MKYFSSNHNRGRNLRPPDLYEYFIDNFYGLGFSNGVPSAQTAGRIIADLMVGESNKFTNYYIVNRKFPYAGPTSLRVYLAKCTSGGR